MFSWDCDFGGICVLSSVFLITPFREIIRGGWMLQVAVMVHDLGNQYRGVLWLYYAVKLHGISCYPCKALQVAAGVLGFKLIDRGLLQGQEQGTPDKLRARNVQPGRQLVNFG